MRSVSLFTNALLVLLLGLFGTLYVPVLHAQTNEQGMSCNISGPSIGCNTAQIPKGVACTWTGDQYSCFDPGGLSGENCDFDSSGDISCVNTGTSNSVGGAGTGGTVSGGMGNVTNGTNSVSGGGWLDKLTGWIGNSIHSVVQALVAILKDVIVSLFATLFALVELIVSLITPPSFLSTYSLGGLLGRTGSIVGFFMSVLNIGPALGMIGAAYAFRLIRKFATLFQW